MGKFSSHLLRIIVLIVVIGCGFLYFLAQKNKTPEWVTGAVSVGDVEEIVAVSGVLEATDEVTLSFPVAGIVSDVLVEEGAVVSKNQVLALLDQSELKAQRQEASAAIMIAQANRNELLEGPRSEARSVTEAAVNIAQSNLSRTISAEAVTVEGAYRTLLSDSLEAFPTNPNEEAIPPTITGTYTCGKEGVYTVEMYRSDSSFGYSYRLSGLEEGTFTAYAEAAAPLGACGLYIQFAADARYSNSVWEIPIPNTKSSNYVTNLNAYIAAKEQESNAIKAATQELDKAIREQTLENSTPRSTAIRRADAVILQASAQLAALDARMLSERTLRAPFDGVVSAVDISSGEVAGEEAVHMVASDQFTLTVRVPEIDITHISMGQIAEAVFDARPDEPVRGVVSFISESATEIDGVAYFKAKIRFDSAPAWFRSGLNADVDIIVDTRTKTLRVPKRFVLTEGDAHFLLYPDGTDTRRTPVELVFTGNDGFAAITGAVREGDTIVAP